MFLTHQRYNSYKSPHSMDFSVQFKITFRKCFFKKEISVLVRAVLSSHKIKGDA